MSVLRSPRLQKKGLVTIPHQGFYILEKGEIKLAESVTVTVESSL